MTVNLKGYAIVFGTACRVGSMWEYADADSFRSALARQPRPFLTYGSHDAEPIGQIDEMFADDFGLGFSASIAEPIWRAIRWQLCQSDQRVAMSFCSISMTGLQHERVAGNGRVYHRIAKAGIDHICITDQSAVYPTGIWPAEVHGNMPRRLARLADSWDRGHVAHREAERRARAKALAATKARLAAEKAKPTHHLPADRLAAFEAFRERVAASIAMGHSRSAILCHAALTKAGGFDPGRFDQQIQAFRNQPRPAVWS
jgi:hypothetical protein